MNILTKFATYFRKMSPDQKEKVVAGSISLGGGIGGLYGLRFGYMRSTELSFGEHVGDSLGGCLIGVCLGTMFVALSPITVPITAGVATMRNMYPSKTQTYAIY